MLPPQGAFGRPIFFARVTAPGRACGCEEDGHYNKCAGEPLAGAERFGEREPADEEHRRKLRAAGDRGAGGADAGCVDRVCKLRQEGRDDSRTRDEPPAVGGGGQNRGGAAAGGQQKRQETEGRAELHARHARQYRQGGEFHREHGDAVGEAEGCCEGYEHRRQVVLRDRARRGRHQRGDQHEAGGEKGARGRREAEPEPAEKRREERVGHVEHTRRRHRQGLERGGVADPAQPEGEARRERPEDRPALVADRPEKRGEDHPREREAPEGDGDRAHAPLDEAAREERHGSEGDRREDDEGGAPGRTGMFRHGRGAITPPVRAKPPPPRPAG